MDEREDAAQIYGTADAARALLAIPLSPAEEKSYGQSRLSVKKKLLGKWREGRHWPADRAITHASSLMTISRPDTDRS
ncbi:MAG TPA: hypothetical protein VJ302_00055 [Blastocatellia bacterium]|nr:hypothetical protein [Blastocatellia bacterium]